MSEKEVPEIPTESRMRKEIFGLIWLACGILLLLCLTTFSNEDPSFNNNLRPTTINNFGGLLGAHFSDDAGLRKGSEEEGGNHDSSRIREVDAARVRWLHSIRGVVRIRCRTLLSKPRALAMASNALRSSASFSPT